MKMWNLSEDDIVNIFLGWYEDSLIDEFPNVSGLPFEEKIEIMSNRFMKDATIQLEVNEEVERWLKERNEDNTSI